MAFVIKHALRAKAGSGGGYRPEGWHPELQLTLMGETPASAELVWTVTKPDGSAWFSDAFTCPELSAGEMTSLVLRPSNGDLDIDEPGEVAFTLRIVSELDGIDESLHSGTLTAVGLEAEHHYGVDHDWLLSLGLVCIDTNDDVDGPRLRVTAFFKGQAEAWQIEAYCFHDGKRFAQAEYVSDGYVFSSNNGDRIGLEVIAEFPTVRGWNNIGDSWSRDDLHFLDGHDGTYEVKFVREKKVSRVVTFTVTDGLIDNVGAIEFDQFSAPVLLVDAAVEGTLDGDWSDSSSAAFFGDATTAALYVGSDAMYAGRIAHEAPAAPAFDDDTAEALQRYFDRVERLLSTWESDMLSPQPSYSFDEVLQAEALVREEPGYLELYAAIGAVPAGHPMELLGAGTTVGDMHSRTTAMIAAAQQRISGAAEAEENALAPFRAVLANDKLAIFEDHPAPDFRYYTTNKKIIETPEELAAAEFWYFEGSNETRGSGTVDGMRVDVSVEGWRVLGWKFDADGNTLDEFEVQGQGGNAPKNAFTHE